MRVRLTQLDGALPNLALMRLASYHLAQRDEIYVTRRIERDLFELPYDRVYGSTIFSSSRGRLERFRQEWPHAIVGGTGSGSDVTVEHYIGPHPGVDYTGYDDFDASIGFSQRGCRLRCRFWVVPTKEGKNRSVATMMEVWRGEPWPKKVHLLDNDFFGQPEIQWRARIKEIQTLELRVCLSQGINVRLITRETAEALASIEYRDTKFSRRRLYTAWDNLGDENVFFRGIDILEQAGIPPQHVMAYMLVGYDRSETWERIWHRFNRMVDRGIRPYPMVYDRARKDLCAFQRWVNLGLYRIIPWDHYRGKRTCE
ncbi:MAG: radical SAM protein [Steroidobacteraceae bacterium]